jgi:hypothetical protein
MAPQNQQQQELAAAAIRLPDFYADSPQAWFDCLDAMFATAKLTCKVKPIKYCTYISVGGLTVGNREIHMRASPHACAVMPWMGTKLGLGCCSYDASTIPLYLFIQGRRERGGGEQVRRLEGASLVQRGVKNTMTDD